MSDMLSPKDFRYDKFILKSYKDKKETDITYLVYSMNILESMAHGSLRGTIRIFDTVNLLNTFPLRGEEKIELAYVDSSEIEKTHKLMVYAVDDITPNTQGTGVIYNIHFTSEGKLGSERKKIRRAFQNMTISSMVKNIWDDYYKPHTDKEIEIELTNDPQTLIIPDLTPEEAMHFLSRRAYSTESHSQTFRFFETRDKYYFCTLEYLQTKLGEVPTSYVYDPIANYNGQELRDMIYKIISISNKERVDTFLDFRDNSYRKKTIEINVLEKRLEENDYRYLENYRDYFDLNGYITPKHTQEFVDDHFEDSCDTRVVYKDYSISGNQEGYRSNPRYVETFHNKSSVFSNLRTNPLVITVYGNNKLQAGSIISVEINEFNGELDKQKKDMVLSGNYFVESVNNLFVENSYTQELVLHKLDWGKIE